MAPSRKATPAASADVFDLDVEVELDDVAVERSPRPRRKTKPPARRRGRPADSDGLTRDRILAAARACFAEAGYSAASTHMVAARVGLTTGALYHHFASKRDLFLAVLDEVEILVDERFQAAAAGETTLCGKLEAVINETAKLTAEDPTVAGFALSVTSDVARHPDLSQAFAEAWSRRDTFFGEIVDAGIAAGEVAPGDRRMVLETITTMVTGLLVVSAGIPSAQARAVEGMKRLLAGTLLQ